MSARSVTPQIKQVRGAAARMARLVASRARTDVDLRSLLHPEIISQGPRPTCVPFAIAGAHEAARSSTGVAPQPLAPESIWWYCAGQGQTGPEGMLLLDGGNALLQVGQPLMSHWPYNDLLGIATEQPPGAAGTPPWQTGILRELHLANDGVEDELEDFLAAGSPVILLVEVTDEFYDPRDDGHVDLPNIRAHNGDYHAVLCIGAATHQELGRRLLIRNSWGDYWGVGGYCWLPLAYLVAFVPQAAVINIA